MFFLTNHKAVRGLTKSGGPHQNQRPVTSQSSPLV